MTRWLSEDEIGTWIRPPLYGDAWMDPRDIDVGTTCYRSEYLWYIRIHLQVRVADGRITDARCFVEDDDSKGSPEQLAAAIGQHLTNRPLSTALEFDDSLFWSTSAVREAIYDSLIQWAGARTERLTVLPPSPYRQAPPGRMQRVLRGLRDIVRL